MLFSCMTILFQWFSIKAAFSTQIKKQLYFSFVNPMIEKTNCSQVDKRHNPKQNSENLVCEVITLQIKEGLQKAAANIENWYNILPEA